MPDTAVTSRNPAERDAALLADEALLQDERRYCSFGDTVHYSEPPKIFTRADGSWLFDGAIVGVVERRDARCVLAAPVERSGLPPSDRPGASPSFMLSEIRLRATSTSSTLTFIKTFLFVESNGL